MCGLPRATAMLILDVMKLEVSEEFGKDAPLTLSRDKALGMKFDFTEDGVDQMKPRRDGVGPGRFGDIFSYFRARGKRTSSGFL